MGEREGKRRGRKGERGRGRRRERRGSGEEANSQKRSFCKVVSPKVESVDHQKGPKSALPGTQTKHTPIGK